MKLVFDFDHHHTSSPMVMREMLGGKGANLAEMTSVLKLPVPPGFTIVTEGCRRWMAIGTMADFIEEIAEATSRLEQAMGKRLGDAHDPLLVSVRSGARFSMPGMMDTVLNLGLNDQSVGGLTRQTNDERFALDSYRRFIAMYSKIVLGVNGALFDQELDHVKVGAGIFNDADLSSSHLADLVVRFQGIVGAKANLTFPQDPHEQLHGAIEAVFRSWDSPRANAYRERERIPRELGTAVNVQAMVFGNRDDNSGTGVGFTRNPATGERSPYGDFLINAQGEDVVAGIRITEPLSTMKDRFAKSYDQLLHVFEVLERHYLDMCDTEFTIERGRLWMLQTRVGKRSGAAALRMAVEMTDTLDLGISRHDALMRILPSHIDQVLHPQLATPHADAVEQGLGASPGAAVGRCYFNASDAETAKKRGERVLLIRAETSPEDVQGLLAAEGVLTARGGLVSHAAVVARGWGKPAVVGVEKMVVGENFALVGGNRITTGDWLSIDGATGEIFIGALTLIEATAPSHLETILAWADEVRKGHLGIRANADSGKDAAVARALGAEGIGLCRTEHMFLAEDRLSIIRRVILANNPEEERRALEEMRCVQRMDFCEILKAMDGLPVTIRLLDPPLHEFLPPLEELTKKHVQGVLDEHELELLAAVRDWCEVNPMLGTRGVRLGLVRPGLYQTQVRALIQAVLDRIEAGGDPRAEVMIPLVISRAEFEMARSWVDKTLDELVAPELRRQVHFNVGTMIETPRATVVAGDIAESADFFSFGTNDLTQMTLGFSRDDVEGRLMKLYLEHGLLPHNPFESIDVEGVGELMRIAINSAREIAVDLKIGVCGEHAGDPISIDFFTTIGVDYVSCSPYRIPMARLAAGQSILARRNDIPRGVDQTA